MDNQEKTTSKELTTNLTKSVPYHRATISNHYHQQKSHAYDAENIAEMGKRLNAIAYSMGFKTSMSPEELLSLSQWIKTQFGDVSMQEVALAFDLVTAKKIGLDIRHYNSFSKQYIGDVLYAFKSWRAKQIILFKEHQKAKELQESTFESATGQEMYEGIKTIALKTGKVMKVADWTGAYNYAWKENLIHRMNDQERSEYKYSLIEALKSEKRGGIIPDNFNIDASIQAECHRRILQAHFQKMIDDNKVSEKGE